MRRIEGVLLGVCVLVWAYVFVALSNAGTCDQTCTSSGTIPMCSAYSKIALSNQAACDAQIATLLAQHPTYTCSDGTGCTANGWVGYKSCGWGSTYYKYWYVDNEYCNNRCNRDNDCLMDDIDPYPEAATSFTFQEIAYQLDANGKKTFVTIKTSLGDYVSYGTRSDSKVTYSLGTGAPVRDGCQLEAAYFDETSTATIPNATIGTSPVATSPFTSPTMDTGVEGDAANDTDHTILDKIADNTAKGLANDADIVNALGQIAGAIGKQTDVIASKESGGGGISSGGLTEAQTEQAVEEGIGTALDDRTMETPDVTGTGDASGISTAHVFGEGEVPEGQVLATELDNAMSQIPGGGLSDLFADSGVEANGGYCSFNWTYMGKQATFSICGFADQFEMMGYMVLALASIYGLMIVLGKT